MKRSKRKALSNHGRYRNNKKQSLKLYVKHREPEQNKSNLRQKEITNSIQGQYKKGFYKGVDTLASRKFKRLRVLYGF